MIEGHSTTAVQFHNVRQPQPYYYGLHGRTNVGLAGTRSVIYLARAGDVYLTNYGPERINRVVLGRQRASR